MTAITNAPINPSVQVMPDTAPVHISVSAPMPVQIMEMKANSNFNPHLLPVGCAQPISHPRMMIPVATPSSVGIPIDSMMKNLPVHAKLSGQPPKKKPKTSGGLKSQTVAMATVDKATPSEKSSASSVPGAGSENTGRWTADEHRLFLHGLELHGKGWKKIACLIKSRTVVQIRTHAQKYFQKLAKARQNGEEGDVPMEGRGGLVPSVSVGQGTCIQGVSGNPKRRRQSHLAGMKRKTISGVVASAVKHVHSIAMHGSNPHNLLPSPRPDGQLSPPTVPIVAPVLAPYVVPNPMLVKNKPLDKVENSAPGPIPNVVSASSTSSLESSLFRFLTPATTSSQCRQTNNAKNMQEVNNLARQGIVAPHSDSVGQNFQKALLLGEGSPTGVSDINSFPTTWGMADEKSTLVSDIEAPKWYSSGADVDELLNEADTLDWLADSGELDESCKQIYSINDASNSQLTAQTISNETVSIVSASDSSTVEPVVSAEPPQRYMSSQESSHLMPSGMRRVSTDNMMMSLPSLFGGSNNYLNKYTDSSGNGLKIPLSGLPSAPKPSVPSYSSATEAADSVGLGHSTSSGSIVGEEGFFDSNFDEQAFVSALLESSGGDSATALPALS
eukprot:CAMPEP_0194374534 /NCGR_PEP_ID=MMETSP0174-20130528/22955_1 /TAXON_ID=216777 /ORGANISM="Proboscia alata, Strain PI-D3" /LENGTH=614 /DNA_ID=CAMNT_0039154161 /DNA_START=121 /DNA_END=1965 /DNA_ORIENTATION=+